MAERSSCQEKRLILSFSPKSFIYSHILSVANSNIQLFSQSFLQSFNQSNVISSVIQPIKRWCQSAALPIGPSFPIATEYHRNFCPGMAGYPDIGERMHQGETIQQPHLSQWVRVTANMSQFGSSQFSIGVQFVCGLLLTFSGNSAMSTSWGRNLLAQKGVAAFGRVGIRAAASRCWNWLELTWSESKAFRQAASIRCLDHSLFTVVSSGSENW